MSRGKETQKPIPRASVTTDVKIAGYLGHIFDPGLCWVYGIFFFSLAGIASPLKAILLATALCAVFLGLIAFVLFSMGHLDRSNYGGLTREQRLDPRLLGASLGGIGIGAALVLIFAGPVRDLLLMLLVATELSIAIHLSYHRIKSSGHMAAISSLVCALVVSMGLFFLVFSPLIVLVAWSRLKLGVHTTKEVLVGFLLGSIVASVTFFVGLRV